MKFIHTSDWHLGRQLHNQSLLEDQAFVLDALVDMVKEHQVDAVVIAGDVYDRAIPPAAAVNLLDDVLHRIVVELEVPVVMIAGNHDSHERLGFGARQMLNSGLYITGPLQREFQAIKLTGKNANAWFYPIPYVEPATIRHLYDCPVSTHQEAMSVLVEPIKAHDSQGLPKVVVAHCFIDGGAESDSERPLSIGGADKISPQLFEPFDYVALGHLHGPQYKGQEYVRYSGSILKYSFSEQHQNKSVTLVELDHEGQLITELLPLPALRDVRIVEGYLADLLVAGKADENANDYLMVRLLDKHAILDAMGKLRAVFPHVLHLERTGLMNSNTQLQRAKDHIKKGEMSMFEDFFSQVYGESLTPEQNKVITNIIDSLHQGERNG
ncbi:exonuclease SbcCD subunit D [Shewanella gelidii]|uniref:Nuclease SbcCD subunit D n=1 Tax=Shewanella gelidii TaxID=1642821 RepID=A0A917JLK9_9GAMM|nr:exonuclease SbcCD subunit D [Shewanella gelidii]MCL1097481.1 exonuclease SbcCD subunit D [Shewanella gelidii]GGI75575.1 nuclease SbcCD subunit D [Shewanella gelidii]